MRASVRHFGMITAKFCNPSSIENFRHRKTIIEQQQQQQKQTEKGNLMGG